MGPANRPLDLDWIDDFIALAETGNFTRAAEARAIAQPAFSRHIRSLEDWVGVELFDRASHPAQLTAAGRRIHPLLQDVAASLQAARIKARIAHDQAAASLRFASTHVLSLSFFPRWLARVEARQPLGPIQTAADHDQACEDLMAQRRVQFLLCYGHDAVPGRLDDGTYPMRRLGDDLLVPVSAPDASGRAAHHLERGDPLPMLEYTEVSGLGRILNGVLKGAFTDTPGRGPRAATSVVFTAHDAMLLKRMALDGRGLAWLPRSVIEDELAAGRLMAAGDARWCVPLEIRLYRQPPQMAAAAEGLWRACEGAAGGA